MNTLGRVFCVLAACAPVCLAPGCAARASLHRVVLDYDETVGRAQAEMLLLNIARARHHRPVHFTTVSGIAATFDYRANAGIGGEIAESPGISILTPSFGVSVSENPTISILPIQGEEFTRRLLTPLDESVFGFFYHQGVDPVLLLRLIGHGVIVEQQAGRVVYLNDPQERDDIEAFGRVVTRLGDLHRSRRLEVGPLVFEETWNVDRTAMPTASDLAELIDRGYDFRSGAADGVLVRRVVGRRAITNYDPATLTNSERAELQRRAQEYPAYFALLDIRPDGDGDDGLRGWVKLRSMSGILDAIAAGVQGPEGPQGEVPLRVVESDAPLATSLFDVRYEGQCYSLPREPGNGNQSAFRVLYRLYQMTVSELPDTPVPPVTIAK
jgi:hypothetical protein